jgi:hypothetical protein
MCWEAHNPPCLAAPFEGSFPATTAVDFKQRLRMARDDARGGKPVEAREVLHHVIVHESGKPRFNWMIARPRLPEQNGKVLVHPWNTKVRRFLFRSVLAEQNLRGDRVWKRSSTTQNRLCPAVPTGNTSGGEVAEWPKALPC